jgi:hypothetical protein
LQFQSDGLSEIDIRRGVPVRRNLASGVVSKLRNLRNRYDLNRNDLIAKFSITDFREWSLLQSDELGAAANPVLAWTHPREWISPQGIRFGLDNSSQFGDGTRVAHIILRHGKNAVVPNKSRFLVDDLDIFSEIDDAWQEIKRIYPSNPANPPSNMRLPNPGTNPNPIYHKNICIDLRRPIGTDLAGNIVTGLVISLDSINTSLPSTPNLITAFPADISSVVNCQ